MSGDLRRAAVPQEVLLDGGHGEPAGRDLRGEGIGVVRQLSGPDPASLVKPEEEPARLVGRRRPQLDLAVNPTGTDQRRIEPLRMIRGSPE